MVDVPKDEEERLTKQLSESLLALLLFSDEEGAVAAGLLKPRDFVKPYDEIAKQVLDYRLKFKEPPGPSHIDDVFDDILANPKDDRRDQFQMILRAFLRMHDNGMNYPYILSRAHEYIGLQHYRRTWSKGVDILKQAGPGASEQFESLVNEALRTRPGASLDIGVGMTDKAALEFLQDSPDDILKLGIDHFDKLGICPTRGEMFGFIGPRGSGKSMFCTHVSMMSLLQHRRCLDISLELATKKKAQRIFQCLYAIAKRAETHEQMDFIMDAAGRLTGLDSKSVKPERWLSDPKLVDFLVERQYHQDGLESLRLKKFPSGKLNVRSLEAYLDLLDARAHYQPDVLIVDYPGIMTLSNDNLRLDLARIFVELRGLAEERNMAVVVPHQATRGGEKAQTIKSWHTSETMGLFDTADVVITYNATEQEKEHHLARLFAAKVRNDRDKVTVVISQAYEYSRFVHHSARKAEGYWDHVKAVAGSEVETEGEAGSEDEMEGGAED